MFGMFGTKKFSTNLFKRRENTEIEKCRNVLHTSNDDVTYVRVTALHHSNRRVTCVESDLLHVSKQACYIRKNVGCYTPQTQ
jgi:hypothetical protein